MRNAVNKVARLPRSFPRLPITDLRTLPKSYSQVYEPGLLVQGCSHQLVAPYESGKTFLALICGKKLTENGLTVLYPDYENRARSIRERLEVVGVNEECWNNLKYINCPNIDLSEESQVEWRQFLKYLGPDLIIYDSLNGFLSNAGRDENSSTGFQEWSNVYLKIPRALEITTLVIDHTGWDGTHSRGTSRKPDEFDIVWKVRVKEKFSRRRAGQIELKVVKDRDSLMPNASLTFVIGGDPFKFEAKTSNPARDDLSGDEGKTLNLIRRNSKVGKGTRRKSINELFNGSKSRADRTIKDLLEKNLIWQHEESRLYWAVDSSQDSLSKTESPETLYRNLSLDSSVGEVEREGVPGSRSFRTGPMDPEPPTRPDSSQEEDDGEEAKQEDPNDSNSGSEEVTDMEDGTECIERNVAVDSTNIMEAIDSLDYNSRGIEVLKTVASVLIDNPLVVASQTQDSIQRSINKVLSLAKEEGVNITKKDFQKALRVLDNNFPFEEILKEQLRKLLQSNSTVDREREGSW